MVLLSPTEALAVTDSPQCSPCGWKQLSPPMLLHFAYEMMTF